MVSVDYIDALESKEQFFERVYRKGKSYEAKEQARSAINNLNYFCKAEYQKSEEEILKDLSRQPNPGKIIQILKGFVFWCGQPHPEVQLDRKRYMKKKSPVLFTTDGNPFLNFGGIGIGDERFREPRGIGVNSDGRIYVIDYGKTNLLIFSPYVGIPDPERSIDLTLNEKEAQQRYDAQVYENILKYEEAIEAGYTQEEIITAYDKQNVQQQTTESETLASEEEVICGAGTILKDGFCVPERETMTTEMQQKSGGGCLIVTATFGSELAPQVQQLREIRDNSLLQTESGRSFMESFNQFYYSFSPEIADLERENPIFKEVVKLIIAPLLSSLSLLNYVDMDSEVEVLGYGISLILLNVGMYFVLPAILIHEIKKYAENKCQFKSSI